MSRTKKNLIYAASTLFLTFLIAIFMGLFSKDRTISTVQVFCNAFFVSGVLEGGVGILSYVSKEGGFDFFSYVTQMVVYKFKPKEKLPSYYDYKQIHKETHKTWLKSLAICGALCILIATALIFVC